MVWKPPHLRAQQREGREGETAPPLGRAAGEAGPEPVSRPRGLFWTRPQRPACERSLLFSSLSLPLLLIACFLPLPGAG